MPHDAFGWAGLISVVGFLFAFVVMIVGLVWDFLSSHKSHRARQLIVYGAMLGMFLMLFCSAGLPWLAVDPEVRGGAFGGLWNGVIMLFIGWLAWVFIRRHRS